MNTPTYGYHGEDYIDGYLKGLETGRSMNREGDWLFLAVGFALGLLGALVVATIVT